MTKIIILGANGRMGRLLLSAAHQANTKGKAEAEPIELAAAIVRAGSALVNQPAMDGIKFSSDIGGAMQQADLAIDFSSADSVEQHAALAAQHQVAYLCGVTGLTSEVVKKMGYLSRNIPLLLSANTSLGVMALAQLAKLAGTMLGNQDYELTIKETHHVHKKDKPSGTALMLGDALQTATPTSNINYESVREGEVVGTHEIIFDGLDDVITLKHHAKDRKMFAAGAINVGLWLAKQPPGFYSMENFLQIFLARVS